MSSPVASAPEFRPFTSEEMELYLDFTDTDRKAAVSYRAYLPMGEGEFPEALIHEHVRKAFLTTASYAPNQLALIEIASQPNWRQKPKDAVEGAAIVEFFVCQLYLGPWIRLGTCERVTQPYLWYLQIPQSQRQKGIAKRLLQLIEAEVREAGVFHPSHLNCSPICSEAMSKTWQSHVKSRSCV